MFSKIKALVSTFNKETKVSIAINELTEIQREIESIYSTKERHLSRVNRSTWLTLKQRFNNCILDAMNGFQSEELSLRKLNSDIAEGKYFIEQLKTA